MPELPEVETIKRGLERLIINKTVRSVDFDTPKSFPNSESDVEQFLIGSQIQAIKRRGKALIIRLSSDYSLVVHLKMTGQLVFDSNQEHFGAGHPNASLVAKLPDKSTRVIVRFQDDSKLFFNDQRKFGWMRLMPDKLIQDMAFFKKLGPEPLESDFSWQQLKARLKRRSKTSIKAALLDQSVVAGIGNIYADESLWGAKIHPATMVAALTDKNYRDLFRSVQEILELSLEKGGSTDRNYVDAEGKRGSYLDFARVFRREGQLCPRCQTEIVKTRVAGRGTHYCPRCQRLPKNSKAI